jgi:flagellar hook-associated protein 3 FlgL
MIFSTANENIGQARDRNLRATNVASTGLRVEHPGDDSAAATLVAARRAETVRDDMMGKVIDRASSELDLTDASLGQVGDLLSRARELAVQLSNSNYGAADRASAAVEVQNIFSQAIVIMNTRQGNRYLFGGNLDNAPPFDATGAYVGDTGVRQIEIAPGIRQDVSIRADQALKGVGGGVDVLTTLSGLATALSTNNVDGVRGTLDALDSGISQLSSARGQVGASWTVLDAAKTARKVSLDNGTVEISKLSEADIFESATALALSERALEAAISASAKSFNMTLLNKLG